MLPDYWISAAQFYYFNQPIYITGYLPRKTAEFGMMIMPYINKESFNKKNSGNMPGEITVDNPPAALPLTVNIGIFEYNGKLDEKTTTALKDLLQRVDSLLSYTPGRFRFLIALPPDNEGDIVKNILSCGFFDKKALPDIIFFRKGDCGPVPADIFSGRSTCEIREISAERTTFGYDPVSLAITEQSSLLFIIGKEHESTDSGGKNPYLLAKRYGRTVVSADPVTGITTDIPNDDRIFETFGYFNAYNHENINKETYDGKKAEYIRILRSDFLNSGLKSEEIEPSYRHLLPHYVRARMLGRKYRRLYFLKGILISFLSAFAVFTITMQTLFFPDQPALIWLEVIEIAIVIALMACSRVGNYHIKWIDYNFLSERIRNAFFISIICMTCEKNEDLPPMTPLRTPNDWMALAFENIISSGPPSYCSREADLDSLRKFFVTAWINRRLVHYEREAEKARLRYHSLAVSGEILFTFTLILAVVHALGVGHWERLFNAELPLLMAFLTITLPAFGAAISAVRVNGEYHRNSDRYAHIVRHLSAIKTEMKYISGISDLCALVKEVNEMTFREVHDWKIIFRYTNIEAL